MYYVARSNKGLFWNNGEGYQPLLEAAYRVSPEDVERFTAPLGGRFVEVRFEDEMPLPSEAYLRGNPESVAMTVGRCYPSLVTWDTALPQRMFEELSDMFPDKSAWGRFVFAYPEKEAPQPIPVVREAISVWEAWVARQEGEI